MPNVNRSALVPYSAEQMFDLVDNINAYPEFLPWCGGSEESQRSADTVEASVTIQRGSLHKTFKTRNTQHKPMRIDLQLLDGPFKSLSGRWQFTELDNSACKVQFELDFEFSSRLIAMTVGPVFTQVVDRMIDAFIERAKHVYGHAG